ncbi:MAG: EAL domain-containing protein [Burkholderiales bacterium]|nr:EAL domain-containing protein [Burkholderiales bacterium]
MPSNELFLGRQPILDRDQNLAAFELLFRSSHVNGAQIDDDLLASATVINHAFSELGVETVLGRHKGFINLSAPLIMSDVIELLPRDRVVLELLETVEITEPLVKRLRELRQMGFRLALDDYVGDEALYAEVLDIVDIVKVDVRELEPARLESVTARLRRWPVQLLAEKVDTREQVDRCLAFGYELFQGYYFARPTVLTGKRLSHADTAIVRLLGLVIADADLPALEVVFKQNPDLTINLLRMVNSVGIAGRRRIESLAQAVVVLGRSQLQRWLQLLLFSLPSSSDARYPSPLMVLAATRGRMMELLLEANPGDSTDLEDQAFLTGILSLVSALLGLPLSEILTTLPVPDEVRAALMDREGILGEYLRLVELVEQTDADGISTLLARTPGLDAPAVNDAFLKAIEWANALTSGA